MAAAPEISFQLYSSRNFPPVERQLATLARLGYRNVEPYGGLLGDIAGFKAALDQAGLKAPSGHFGFDTLEDKFATCIADARRLEISLIVCPWIHPDLRPKDREGWAALGRRLGAIGDKVRAEGLRFAWHNHDFEFRPLADGSWPIEHLMADPSINLEIDVAWILRGGADPAKWIGYFSGRIAACHVKDIAPPGRSSDEDGWADVGQGTIDWRTLWRLAVGAGAELMIAEHDNPKDFERFAKTSLAAMKQYADQ
jgi:sugar phosphate isomerase/epimerase